MLIATLVVLNIPVYIFIGWLAFDTKQGAADTFAEPLLPFSRRFSFHELLGL